jgi:hypothetical protein
MSGSGFLFGDGTIVEMRVLRHRQLLNGKIKWACSTYRERKDSLARSLNVNPLA